MAANKKSYDELSISEKIEAKKKKIKRLFREMPPEKRQFAEGLINQFAVTSVTLERLADEINNGDLIEDFVQGAQKLRRESPALRAYNTTILVAPFSACEQLRRFRGCEHRRDSQRPLRGLFPRLRARLLRIIRKSRLAPSMGA